MITLSLNSLLRTFAPVQSYRTLRNISRPRRTFIRSQFLSIKIDSREYGDCSRQIYFRVTIKMFRTKETNLFLYIARDLGIFNMFIVRDVPEKLQLSLQIDERAIGLDVILDSAFDR